MSNGSTKNDKLFEERSDSAENNGYLVDKDNQSIDQESVGVEEILSAVGKPGIFFVYQAVLLCLGVFSVSFPVFNYIFIGFEPEHVCGTVENETELLVSYGLDENSSFVSYGQCYINLYSNTTEKAHINRSLSCINGYDYMGQKHISFVSEWDLVCEKSGMKEIVQTLLMAGQICGAVFFTSLADKLGRKPVMLLSNTLILGIQLAVAYAPDIYTLYALKFFSGVLNEGFGLTSYTLFMEWLVPKHRRIAGVIGGLNWTLSVQIIGILAYLMRAYNWRTFALTNAFFSLNVILYPLFLVESPRWLLTNHKFKEVRRVLKKACGWNGTKWEDVEILLQKYKLQCSNVEKTELPKLESGKKEEAVVKYSIVDLFRYRHALLVVLPLWFVWITNSMIYYGLFLTSSSLAGNRFLNFNLMSVVDIPGDLILLSTLDRFQRRTVISALMMVTAVSLLSATLLTVYGTENTTVILGLVCSLIGKLGISAAFNGVLIYSPELFPTNLRSAGLGISLSISSIGGMLAPFSELMSKEIAWGPSTLFSIMAGVSCFLLLRLPETKGRPLPTTIEEMTAPVPKTSNPGTELEQTKCRPIN